MTPAIPDRIRKSLYFLAKAFALAALLVMIFAYVYFSPPVLTRLHGGLILFPMPPGEEYSCNSINNVKREEIYFKSKDGSSLNAWFFKSDSAKAPVILFSHGNAGNIGHRLLIAKYLMDAGASVFLFDYRGFGKSTGKSSLTACLEDSRAAYDYLRFQKGISESEIVLYGESVGGAVSCALAEKVPSKGLILDSTFSGLLRIAKKKVPILKIYPDFLQAEPVFDNITYLQGRHPPLLIIHGKKDEIIPFEEAEKLYAAASPPRSILELPNSTHNWKDADFPKFTSGIKAFLQDLSKAN